MGNISTVFAKLFLQQIKDRDYDQALRNRGYKKILNYGIAFYHKKCCVLVQS